MPYSPDFLLSRRAFASKTLRAMIGFAVLEALVVNELVAEATRPEMLAWLRSLDNLGHDLKTRRITIAQWQSHSDELLSRVDLSGLIRLIDLDDRKPFFQFRRYHRRLFHDFFRRIDGFEQFSYGANTISLRRGGTVIPHAHTNMVSFFVVLEGRVRCRTYDRLGETDTHYLISPTMDQVLIAADTATMTDEKGNVHWFEATSARAHLLNMHIKHVGAGGEDSYAGRLYLDPLGEEIEPNRIRAEKISKETALERYA